MKNLMEFGAGNRVIGTGTFFDKPAVFIAPASQPGKVGSSAAREGHPIDRLLPGEFVLTFPTAHQASAVADALCNATTRKKLPVSEVEHLKRIITAMKDELMKIETEGRVLGHAVVEPIDKAIKLAQSVEN